MKRVEKLIKNKVSINTYNKSKNKNYLFKKSIYNYLYLFLKFKKVVVKPTIKKIYFKNIFICKNTVEKIKLKTQTSFIKLLLFLLYFVYIKSYKPVTNTVRFKKNMFLIRFSKILKIFKLFVKNSSGRNNSGTSTLYSKSKTKNKNIIILKSNIWDKQIKKIISFIRDKKKIVSLCKHTTGSLSIVPQISGVYINQTVFSTILPKKYWLNNLPGNYVLLCFLSKFSIFSNIVKIGFKKIANSTGTFCQLVDFFTDFNLVKISLPSKKCIFVTGFCFVLLGKNSQNQRKFCCVGKAGINKNNGIKPKVRGVARNPVDHPHGGRTKTNKPEVSIWGWVAKKNK